MTEEAIQSIKAITRQITSLSPSHNGHVEALFCLIIIQFETQARHIYNSAFLAPNFDDSLAPELSSAFFHLERTAQSRLYPSSSSRHHG